MSVGSRLAAASGTLLLVGCVSVPRDPGFDDVEKVVRERIAQRVEWNQDDAADRAIAESLQALLEQELTADAAVQIALLNNRNLQATYEELGVAQADLVAAGLFRNPVFGIEYRFPGRPANPLELHVAGDFIDIFLIPLRQRVAAAAFEREKLRVTNAVLVLNTEVSATFFKYQAAEQMFEMRTTAAQATEATALIALRQHEAGNISDLDLANERALHEQMRADLVLAEIEALDQRERLNALMGLWGPDAARWRTGQRLPEAPQVEFASEGLESLAVSQRLDLAAARHEILALADSVGLARYEGLIPSLNLAGHYEREPEGDATWGPSLEIPIPIFDQGQATVGRAAAKLRQSRQRYWALAVQIRSEVRAARNRVLSAWHLVDHYRGTLLPLRNVIVEESQLQYNAMQIGPFQLLQARQAELDAGRQYIEALRNYWVAWVDLERAVGGRLQHSPADSQPTAPDPSAPQEQERHEQSHGEHK